MPLGFLLSHSEPPECGQGYTIFEVRRLVLPGERESRFVRTPPAVDLITVSSSPPPTRFTVVRQFGATLCLVLLVMPIVCVQGVYTPARPTPLDISPVRLSVRCVQGLSMRRTVAGAALTTGGAAFVPRCGRTRAVQTVTRHAANSTHFTAAVQLRIVSGRAGCTPHPVHRT